MTVTPLHEMRSAPDQDVVEALEEALDLARRGLLRSVFMSGSLTEGRTYTAFACKDLREGLVAASMLQHRLCDSMAATKEPVP